jgi:hypothetical protein
VIGAILVFALEADLGMGIFNLDMIGYILMGAGVVVFILGLVFLFRRRAAVSTSRSAADPVTGERVTRRVTETDDPIV